MRQVAFGPLSHTGLDELARLPMASSTLAMTSALSSNEGSQPTATSGILEGSRTLSMGFNSDNQALLADDDSSSLRDDQILRGYSFGLGSCLFDSPNASYEYSVHPNQSPSISLPSWTPSFLPSLDSLYDLSVTSTSTSAQSPIGFTPGQASLLNSLFSLAHSDDPTPKLIESGNHRPTSSPQGPSWPSAPVTCDEEEGSTTDDEEDPEGAKAIICRTPTPDPNTESNALPFVLQSYAHWVNFVAFEPLKVAGAIREGVIMQFASSPEVRTRICLIANVIGRLSKNPELGQREKSIVLMLRSQAHQHIRDFHSKRPASERPIDRLDAHQALDSIMEMILIQRYSSSLSNIVALMEAAAPVFRRACPESSEQLVNLPNILSSPGLNLQHFAATDVIISVTTARPMFFKYDVTCSPQTYAQLIEGDYGLQWLHGAPDYFIVLLAWINMLYEDYGTSMDPEYITEIESQIRSAKIQPGLTPDPILLVLRFAVQECWRQTLYVYLYMALCGAQADDLRIVRAVRSFVHIINGVRPGRNPDSFLFIPIMVVGGFACRERDRSVLRQRMEGLRECSNPNAASHDCLEVLEDIWLRTRMEDRPAVWSDLRVSYSKIVGI